MHVVAPCVALIRPRHGHCKRVHRLLHLIRVVAEGIPVFARAPERIIILRTVHLVLELLLHGYLVLVLLLVPCVVLAVADHHYKHCTEK